MDENELMDYFVQLLPRAIQRRERYYVKNLFTVIEFQPLPKSGWDINVYNRHGIARMTPERLRRVMQGLQVRLDNIGIKRESDGNIMENTPA